MGVAVEEQRIPAEDNAKNHSEKEDKNGEEEEDTNRSAQPIDAKEPASKGSTAIINKGQILFSNAEKTQDHVDVEEHNMIGGAEQTNLLAVPDEQNTTKKAHIKKKKEKKEKPQILLSKVEKTKVLVDVEDPNSAEQTHLLVVPEHALENPQLKKKNEKRRKRRALEKMKKEQELGSTKTHVPFDIEEPWRWHASYFARLLHSSINEVYEGSILLQSEVKHVILLNTNETVMDTYYLKEGESIHPGSVLEFPCFMVDVREPIERGVDEECEKPPSKRNEKRKRLKRKPQPLRSPEAALLRYSIGMFVRVASSRKGMSPEAKRRKSESPSIPNATTHFPSPNFPRRRQPRKLKSQIWKDFIPIYKNGKLAQGRCKHCHEVFLASQSLGTNHMRRHVNTCVVRKNMHKMVATLCASTTSPQVATLDGWNFSQEESRRDLANMIVQHGLPFSIATFMFRTKMSCSPYEFSLHPLHFFPHFAKTMMTLCLNNCIQLLPIGVFMYVKFRF